MRLNQKQINLICEIARKHFQDVDVFLFGSRVNNQLKGGDIDLFIHSPNEEQLNLANKLVFLAELKRRLGDQKIDIVLDNSETRKKNSFYQSIMKNCIQLKS